MIARILVGTDGSPQAANAVAWASELAKQLEAELVVIHVFETDPAKLPGGYVVISEETLDDMRDRCQKTLETDWSAPARNAGTHWRPLLLDGNPAGSLIDFAEREKAALIVVGNRGRGGLSELLLGSVGHHLVQHSPVPVTIVPSR
jgi:nucleotide-binding universal stress UspA family protein